LNRYPRRSCNPSRLCSITPHILQNLCEPPAPLDQFDRESPLYSISRLAGPNKGTRFS
jgi:hypothetical protein